MQSSYCTVILLGLIHLVPQEKRTFFGNTQKSIVSAVVQCWFTIHVTLVVFCLKKTYCDLDPSHGGVQSRGTCIPQFVFLPVTKLHVMLGSYRVGALTICTENLLVLFPQTLDLFREHRLVQACARMMFMCREYYASPKMH